MRLPTKPAVIVVSPEEEVSPSGVTALLVLDAHGLESSFQMFGRVYVAGLPLSVSGQLALSYLVKPPAGSLLRWHQQQWREHRVSTAPGSSRGEPRS